MPRGPHVAVALALLAAFLAAIAVHNGHTFLAAIWVVVGATNVWNALRDRRSDR